MMKSKLHQATVTGARLDYAGSLTVDVELMELADLLVNEQVHVLDINNGARFETYVIAGERGSKEICVNGAAARLVQPGDRVIIISYGLYAPAEIQQHLPTVVICNEQNYPQLLPLETVGPVCEQIP